VTSWIALARAAHDRGDGDTAEDVLARARGALTGAPPSAHQLAAAIADAVGQPLVERSTEQAAPRRGPRPPQ
jgi:hypothetical protein